MPGSNRPRKNAPNCHPEEAKPTYGKDRLKLILNRVPKRSELAPGEIEKILGLPVYAVLPSSYPELHECYSLGKLLPERSFLGKQIRELAMRMAGLDEQPVKKKFGGLFG